MTSYRIVYSTIIYPRNDLSEGDIENLESELEESIESMLYDYYNLDGFDSEVRIEARE